MMNEIFLFASSGPLDWPMLFSESRGMGSELRWLAHVFNDLEKRLSQPVKGRS